MNVLFLTGEYPPMRGGIADYTRGLAIALGARGIGAAVLTSTAAQPGTVESDGVIQVRPDIARWGWGLFRQARATVAATGADLLHIQYQTGAFAMHPAVNLLPWRLRRGGLPVVTTMHDLRAPYLFPKAGRVRTWANALLMRHSRAVIVTNPQDYALVSSKISLDRLHLIPLANQVQPCPPSGFDRTAFRQRHGLDGHFVVAHFGMINHSKGIGAVVEAAALLRDAGIPVRLLFVGEAEGSTDPTNRSEAAVLRQRLAERGLLTAATFTGHLQAAAVSAWLLAADAAALPFTDGASFRRTSLLAVLAHGLPVVTTAPEPAPTIAGLPGLNDQEHCLLVPRGRDGADVGALAARLRFIHAQPETARQIGERGRRLAAAFTWERVAAAHADLYARVIEETHAFQ